MKGFVLGLALEGRKLWRRLSRARKVSVIGISAAAVVGLAWMAFDARSQGRSDSEGRGIRGSSTHQDDATRPISPDLRAVDAASQDTASQDEDDPWVFKDGIFPGPWRDRQRLEDWKRRRVERYISWMSDIEKAGLAIEKPTESLLRTRKTDGSAMVTVRLVSGVARLTDLQARVVRQMVCGAYRLRPEVVTLTDSMGNS